MPNDTQIAPELLDWYDKNARDLPWRIPPVESVTGIKPNPYHTWLSEIMLQQTKVETVKSYYEFFIFKWPTIMDLAAAKDEEIMEAWAGLGYYRRAQNLIRCAKIVAKDFNGVFPEDEDSLLQLPGVGNYTSAAIQSIGFNKKAVVIDGNVARIISRLFALNTPITLSQKKIKSYAKKLLPKNRFGDYAQALMDLGSKICTPKKPKCNKCPIAGSCRSFHLNLCNRIPYPKQKKQRPIKYGYAFVALTKTNKILLERRPNEGLLGGMLGFPSTQWEQSENVKFNPPFENNWKILSEPVTHVFSHFKLKLRVAVGIIEFEPSGYDIISLESFNRNSLPSLMRKVFDVGLKI